MAEEPVATRIVLTCPYCDSRQAEPSLVISTSCRSCGRHLEIENGKVHVPIKQEMKLTKAGKSPVQSFPSPRKESADTKPAKVTFAGFLRRWLYREPPKRPVDCFHCGHLFSVVTDAHSSQCPKCGGYISLQDYVVDSDCKRSMQTRGNVTVLKTGSIRHLPVICHDFTLFGKLESPVSCSGVFFIRSSGRIVGDIRCKVLRVDRHVEVEIQGTVMAEEALIAGDLRAQITCTGLITLEKRAHLQGVARGRELIRKKGSRHSGLFDSKGPRVLPNEFD